MNVKKVIPFFAVVLITSLMLFAGAFAGGYERTDAINAIPCLGCLALDPKSPEGWFSVEGELPGFIMEYLTEGPVLIDFRTTVCSACDEMDPYVHALAEEYEGRAHFFMFPENFENLDVLPKDSDEYQSYFIFDVKGSGSVDITGVPLFPIITYGPNETGEIGIIFKVLYGSSADGGLTQKANIAQALDEAITLYDSYGGGAVYYSGEHQPMVELFVAMDCVNCPKSEEALVELMDEEVTNFISFVGDAPGSSGALALERERYLTTALNMTIGRPWAVFGGGLDHEQGAVSKTAVSRIYRQKVNSTYMEPLNVSISGKIIDTGTDIIVNVTATNFENSTESLHIQVFLLEVKSRWLNHYTHEPIPYAVVDMLVNDTYDIASEGSEEISETWNGTDILTYSDMRMSNVAVMAIVWHDDFQVTSKLIESGVPEVMYMYTNQSGKSTLPNGSATFDLNILNYQDLPMTVNLTVKNVPASLAINLSRTSLTLPARPIDSISSFMSFDVTVTGSGTAVGDDLKFYIHAEDPNDPTLSATIGLQVKVKSDITPPVILQPTHSPAQARADEEISISVTVGDNVGLESVTLHYYSCDDSICSATFDVNMTLEGGGYVPEKVIKPVELFHNIFHYWITAVDTSGNTNTTIEYNITLEPVVEAVVDEEVGGPSPYNTYGIGFILIFVMVAIGLNVARVSRRDVSPEPEKEDPEEFAEEESEEDDEEETEEEIQ